MVLRLNSLFIRIEKASSELKIFTQILKNFTQNYEFGLSEIAGFDKKEEMRFLIEVKLKELEGILSGRDLI